MRCVLKALDLILVILMVALVIDWKQTMVISMNTKRWRELNPLLGEHPSPYFVSWYFLTIMLVTGVLWATLVPRMSEQNAIIITGVVTVLEVAVVIRNYLIGIR